MLRLRAISATIWSTADVLLRQGLQFGFSIALARLLAPEQFGAFAIVMTFTALAGVFIDSGFAAALIQREGATRTDESTVFWFNLGMATVAAVALGLAAPWISAFFHAPGLGPTIWIMSAAIVASAAGAIHLSLLSKQLDFAIQMKASVASTLISGVAAIIMAYEGYGVFALAAQALISALVTSLVLWNLHRWRPAFEFSFVSLRSMFGFGSFMMLSILLDTIEARTSSLVIGRLYAPQVLGFYTRADSTRQLPSGLLQRIASRVAFPAFSQAVANIDSLRSGMRRGLTGLMFVNTPAMIGLAAVAHPLVITLFGSKWAPASPYLQLLALAGIAVPLHIVNSSALMALGRSALLFRLHLARKLIGIALLVVAAPFGPLAIASSVAISSFAGLFIDAIGPSKFVRYPVLRQLADVAPIVGASLIMGAATTAVLRIPSLRPWTALAYGVPLGAGVYAMTCALLRVGPFMEAMEVVASRLRRKLRYTL